MTGSPGNEKMFAAVDWTAVAVFMLLMAMGWLNIYAAAFDPAHPSIADFSQSYGKQLMWMGVSAALATTLVLLDGKYYHILSYPVYIATLLLVLLPLFIGREVNGARSWLMLGPVALQPAELMKFACALALARCMSEYSFSLKKGSDNARVAAILGLPMAIILLQNDTGSAVVYLSFMFMLYREGLSGWWYAAGGMAVALFILSMLLEPFTLLTILVAGCALAAGIHARRPRAALIYMAAVALAASGVYWASRFFTESGGRMYYSLLAVVLLSLVPIAWYALRARMTVVLRYAAMLACSIIFAASVDYVFDNVVQTHQQKRVLDLLGIENALRYWGYNVNQSKIAIGSGGLLGKGYMRGTQTRFDFVPEQSTDFIFCTVGEEWGFMGSAAVRALFMLLIYRLMRMGERQNEAFGRVYCYCVASVFMFHVAVNVGMTIGLMPVIGIPLPLFSYGGSSLVAFTLLFFAAVKLDSQRREIAVYTF